jgi:hypothetical protein
MTALDYADKNGNKEVIAKFQNVLGLKKKNRLRLRKNT